MSETENSARAENSGQADRVSVENTLQDYINRIEIAASCDEFVNGDFVAVMDIEAELKAYVNGLLAARDAEMQTRQVAFERACTAMARALAEKDEIIDRLQSALHSIQMLHGDILVGIRACVQVPTDYRGWSGLVKIISDRLIEILYQKPGDSK